MSFQHFNYNFNQIFYRKVLDSDECKKLEDYYTNLDVCIPADHKIENESASKQKFLTEDEGYWLKEKLKIHIKELNDKFYNFHSLKFGRFGLLELRPNKSTYEHWHHDVGIQFPYSQRKLTIVIFIKDRSDYEGGQLDFIPKLKEPLKMEKGYMVVFPSHKIHKVSIVTKGLRRTIINWLYEYQPEIDNFII